MNHNRVGRTRVSESVSEVKTLLVSESMSESEVLTFSLSESVSESEVEKNNLSESVSEVMSERVSERSIKVFGPQNLKIHGLIKKIIPKFIRSFSGNFTVYKSIRS